MAIQLAEGDFDRLAGILGRHGEWQTVHGRIDVMGAVLEGSPRKHDILKQISLDGTPGGTAVRVIRHLSTFGQDEPGRESLGVLINKLLAYLGGGDDADLLRDLLARYPFTTSPVAARGLDAWRGTETEGDLAERIIGENTLRDVFVMELLLEAARAVVRIRGPWGVGTGFLIADDLVMTNHHVIAGRQDLERCYFDFDFQLDRNGSERPARTARARDGGLFHTSPMAAFNATLHELDYTVVQLTGVPPGIAPLPLKPVPVEPDSRLAIIQHPGGLYKKISLQNNFVEYSDALVVQYTTSTEPGSSGSPVLNDNFDVVAIHHAGGDLSEPATKRRYLRNEGVRMSAILDDLRRRQPDIFKRVTAREEAAGTTADAHGAAHKPQGTHGTASVDVRAKGDATVVGAGNIIGGDGATIAIHSTTTTKGR